MSQFNTMGDSQWGQPEEKEKKPRSVALPWSLFALTLLGLGAVLYFGQKLVTAEQADAEAARAAGRDLASRLRELETGNQTLEARVKELEAEKGILSTERDTLSQSLAEREAELAKLKATHDELEEKLKAELAQGDVVLSNNGGRVQVDLVDKVLFASGDASLSPRGEEVLARIGAVLAKQEDRVILVSGHTDDSPITDKKLKAVYPSNWELSTARAVNVVRFLSEKGGVPAKRMVAAGHGEYRPVATNVNAKGRARNRRIELLLMPDLEARKAELATPAKGTEPAKVQPAKGKR